MSEVTTEQETATNGHGNIALEQEILARDHMEHHEETFF